MDTTLNIIEDVIAGALKSKAAQPSRSD